MHQPIICCKFSEVIKKAGHHQRAETADAGIGQNKNTVRNNQASELLFQVFLIIEVILNGQGKPASKKKTGTPLLPKARNPFI